MKRYFYSYDGVIWYWGCYSKDDILLFIQQGVRVMRDNWWNRLWLS